MKTGVGLASGDLKEYRQLISHLPFIELEDFLSPDFADRSAGALPQIQGLLESYPGEILLSGPYIDLNPGTPDALVRRAVRRRFAQVLHFATGIAAREIIFLSTFLPIIRLPAYDEDWIARSISFWKSFLKDLSPDLALSLCNTFEPQPEPLLRVVRGVGCANFRLAFDLGHYLVYGEIPLKDWLSRIASYCSTVYVHSNDRSVDTHDPPYVGKLRPAHLALLRRWLPEETRLIAKPFDKACLPESVAWIEAAHHADRE